MNDNETINYTETLGNFEFTIKEYLIEELYVKLGGTKKVSEILERNRKNGVFKYNDLNPKTFADLLYVLVDDLV